MSENIREGWFWALFYALRNGITREFKKAGNLLSQVNLVEIAKEVLGTDPEVKAALRAQIRRLLLEEITNIQSLDELDLTGEFRLPEHLTGDSSLANIVKDALANELKEPLRARAVAIMLEEFQDLDSDDFLGEGDWDVCLKRLGVPDLFLDTGKDVLLNDIEVVAALRTKAQEQAIEVINGIDDGSFVEDETWDRLKQALSVSTILGQVLEDVDVQKLFAAKLQAAIGQAFAKEEPPTEEE